VNYACGGVKEASEGNVERIAMFLKSKSHDC